MPELLSPKNDDFCPCGSSKKWKRCHGDGYAHETLLVVNPEVDSVLIALATNVLATLKEAIDSIQVDDANDQNIEDAFRKRTLLYFAKKEYRVTKAGVTLIQLGQTAQAFTMKRDQHYAWAAFHYYYSQERESILFCASGPLRQRDKAVEVMGFQPESAADVQRQRQLREHELMSEQMYAIFPDLKVVRGKSGATPNPIYIDWSEPSDYAMMESLVREWPDELAKAGQPIAPDKIEEFVLQQTKSAQFFHATFPSQDIHGTPMGLVGELNAEHDDANRINLDAHEPNGLLYIYMFYPMGVAQKLVEMSGAHGFKDRFTKIHKALESYRNAIAEKAS